MLYIPDNAYLISTKYLPWYILGKYLVLVVYITVLFFTTKYQLVLKLSLKKINCQKQHFLSFWLLFSHCLQKLLIRQHQSIRLEFLIKIQDNSSVFYSERPKLELHHWEMTIISGKCKFSNTDTIKSLLKDYGFMLLHSYKTHNQL